MKFPGEINAFCENCNQHTLHKVSMPTKGQRRALAIGERRHKRKLKGHGGKRAGKKEVKKQGKRQKVILTCSLCKKKQERVFGSRTRKKIEIQK
jgi:ribosomal protein L44E